MRGRLSLENASIVDLRPACAPLSTPCRTLESPGRPPAGHLFAAVLSVVLREHHLMAPFNRIFFDPSCYCELLAIKLDCVQPWSGLAGRSTDPKEFGGGSMALFDFIARSAPANSQ